jgi:hypothetical protein
LDKTAGSPPFFSDRQAAIQKTKQKNEEAFLHDLKFYTPVKPCMDKTGSGYFFSLFFNTINGGALPVVF